MTTETYNVGGLGLQRPFRLRRLAHVHYFSRNLPATIKFYTELLGMRISDTTDLTARAKDEDQLRRMGDPHLYFTRFGSDHHQFILSSATLFEVLGFAQPPKVRLGQIAWQVDSLQQVVDGHDWFKRKGLGIMRAGRDTPGSNWNAYFGDPAGHPNEVFYGMEQIGWSGRSKPRETYPMTRQIATTPQPAEEQEVDRAAASGLDLNSGNRPRESREFDTVVGGVFMPRPFKIIDIGPLRLFTEDMQASLAFYRDTLGLIVTEELVWRGHRMIFLRTGTEHHSLALYPLAMAKELGLTEQSLCLALGLRLNDYQQLKDAIQFLKAAGAQILYLPAEISPGIDYAAYVVDPDGGLIQLYYYMEQLGWEGKPRPPELRRHVKLDGSWPDTLSPMSDSFGGQVFMGPWA